MKFKSVVPVMCAGLALGLGVVACGGDDEPDEPRATATQAADGGAAPLRRATSRSRSAPRPPTTAG